MAIDIVTSASFVPASEILSQTVEAILETVVATNDVLFKKDSFKELATYLERIVPVLKELNRRYISSSESLNNAIEILNEKIKAAKQLTLECSTKSKVYLLMNSRGIVRRLEGTMREISRALSLLPLTSLELSSAIVVEIGNLCDSMQKAEFKAAIAEEEILEKIETGIQERNADRSYANSLLVLIAEAVGIPTERSALKKELEDFKNEIENVRLRKDKAEAIQMDQIIALLGRADAACSPKEKEMKYFTKRKSLGSQPLEPLQSFYCPITRDVMVDPVETSSGQTFERSAIEKWFTEGNNLCPLTMTPLDTSILRPNKTLRQSIEEWKDRNTMITIASMKPNLTSGDEEEVLHCLGQLKDLCEQRDLHREWVILENYIPVLIQLLGGKNRDIRNGVLVILHILTKDSDDAKDRMAKVDGAIESVVRSLGRRMDERRLAVALLLELSKYNVLRGSIGKVQGCIFLLVTMTSGDDNQAARDAEEILENLSFSDQNIIQMARANYFKHLLQRLSTGPEDVKVNMATTVGEMELTDHNKVVLLEGGALGPLLHWVSHGSIQMKSVAVKALRNLSSVPKNGLQMIKEGASRPLLDLLRLSSSSPTLREQVAATVMNLAVSTISQESNETQISLLESDEDIFMLFSLINLTGPEVQQNILQTFEALCHSPSAANIKNKMTQCSAIQVLIQLCERDIENVRPNAVKLFCCLVNDGDEASILEHVHQKCLETLLRIIQSSNDEEEVASAVGIISNLPENVQITQWLVDAGAIPIIFHFLRNVRHNDSYRSQLVENAVGAICRFTAPTNLEWQKRAAEAGVIPTLVHLLDSGTTLTKNHAATSLSRFSLSSVKLSQPIPKRKGFWCLSAPPETGCQVHGGICSVESSFCLVEADAVRPLVRVLEESDPAVCEASLDALLTLIEGERLQSGSKVLAQANAITPMIKFLSSPSLRLQEKALHALERIFRLPEFKQKYGPAAQMPLVDLTQRGNSSMKSLSARILAHLNVLHDQSSYF
ncbi:U-box domain-containing protein 44-like [Durio zibethinus]|uniref:RING-type E3 ubiquitin transferase n=1 Tax=Durio zibethinus TaxID=66656 RepID=A0A6P5ZYI9_DURZI|nr:U-box domain-containing protein 44-like [Durio zibethinus]XP_022757587.1 U-box domain-containing protein 44-like [Durio zibethinus]XP_022757588.1 U-box domain-containing protein 44-like [Durio zibethinus]